MAMDSVERSKARILEVVAGSEVPEDFPHAKDTLSWVLRLEPSAGPALQLAALGHDIDRAVKERKVSRADFQDYDTFKAAHARNGAAILLDILETCGVTPVIAAEAGRLVTLHEVGGDPHADLLKDADSISYFKVNLPFYFQREGWEEAKRRSVWGYRRLSPAVRRVARNLTYEQDELNRLLRQAIEEAEERPGDSTPMPPPLPSPARKV